MAHNTVILTVPETYEAIIQEFLDEHIVLPNTPDGWLAVGQRFATRWQYYNTTGSLDAQHIAIKWPRRGRSTHHNYNGFHSIVFVALVDADYKFLYCNVCAADALPDGGVLAAKPLRAALEAESLERPEPVRLPEDNKPVPFHIVAEDALPLRRWSIKPNPARGLTKEKGIFNYRLPRASLVVQNPSGILTSR